MWSRGAADSHPTIIPRSENISASGCLVITLSRKFLEENLRIILIKKYYVPETLNSSL